MSANGRPCILLCVTGCIAAYKSCEIARALQKGGCRVKVLMTEHATEFVGPLTFRSLTHEPVAVGLFDDPSDPIHHISLAQEADLVLIAPATANALAKIAHGIADDLFSTTVLATAAPVMVAPAMNSGMWRAQATRENVETLRRRGVLFIGPDSGYLACGDVDEGRLADPERIATAALGALGLSRDLAGERVLVTAGPTHEAIDPVRFIGNRSSGKMGCAVAEAARDRGAEVDLVLGPVSLDPPAGVRVIRVESAAEMLEAAKRSFEDATIAVLAAAVSDYTPAHPATAKLKKSEHRLDVLELEETADILATLSSGKGPRTVVGFAAETNDLLRHAREKLSRKGCDLIVANDVSRAESGFGSDTDKVWLLDREGERDLPLMAKREVADAILDRVLEMRRRPAAGSDATAV